MTNSPIVPKPTRRDPALIDAAPLELEPGSADAGIVADTNLQYLEIIGDLASRVEELQAELERANGKKTVDEVRADMLEGYSNRVFCFVAAYCVVVGIMLLLAGWAECTHFRLSDTILGIIAGSTAISVIGMIGMVITGLFGSSPAAKARAKKG
jgi:hypothetical protein